MAPPSLCEDTQVTLLLCGRFGPSAAPSVKPLTPTEYHQVETRLGHDKKTLKDLLTPSGQKWLQGSGLPRLPEILLLLHRGAAMALALEKWESQNLWTLSVHDAEYPTRLRQAPGLSAPPILYGAGNRALLSQGGVGAVGSRDLDEPSAHYARALGKNVAKKGWTLVSGGAKGVDTLAMEAALLAGGAGLCILADSLIKASVKSSYRTGLLEERLVLVTPYYPEATFSVGNAMGRNKFIYLLADRTVVVCSRAGSGGTWEGAIEALERLKRPVYVRMDERVTEGNRLLIERGGLPMSPAFWKETARPVEDEPTVTPQAASSSNGTTPSAPGHPEPNSSSIIYEVVLPILIKQLKEADTPNALSAQLDIQPSQLKLWLDRAVQDGHLQIKKVGRSKGYIAANPTLF